MKDYYHVGVVTAENPPEILHVTKKSGKSGVFREASLSGWQWAGEPAFVTFGEDVTLTLTREDAQALLRSLQNAL